MPLALPGKALVGELIAEAVAVGLIITLGDSVAAMVSLYDPSPYQHAYWGVCITWGLAVTLAIYTTGSVSGCHANPAVTLALACYRRFPWSKVLPYFLAQVVGGFCGAVLVYCWASLPPAALPVSSSPTPGRGLPPGTPALTRSSSRPSWSSASLRSRKSTTNRRPGRTPGR